MPQNDDFAAELRGDEDEPLNAKGNDWVATIVGGLIVGVCVSFSNRWFSSDNDNTKTLVEVATKVEYLAGQVNKLTEQPYVRRDEFESNIKSVQNRVTGLDERVDRLEGRATTVREADRRR
jgi:hypothetical protein